MGLIVSLFFLWGMANNLNDVLIPHFRKAFALSDLASGLVQSAFYLGYFLVAIPAALFMQRYGYKNAVIFGLGLYGAGALLFVPAAHAQSYLFFLAALFVIAGGLAFLETAANPMVASLGPAEDAERRLNFAQAFNPLGSIAGIVIGSTFILSGIERTPEELAAMGPAAVEAWRAQEAAAVRTPYLIIGLGVLFWALLIALTRFPAVAGRSRESHLGSGGGAFRQLFRRPLYLSGVFAQFCYVGAQVGLWSYTIRYVQAELPGTPEKRAADLLIVALVLFMAGRFTGTMLMKRTDPLRLLAWFAAINAALVLVAAVVGGMAGVVALTLASFFMSIMFPTIFAASLRGLGPLTKLGSSLIVMAIIGGAVLTAAMGLLSDLTGTIRLAMLVPSAAFVAVILFARKSAGAAA
ncbi:L-fucose:H+ symporter permease [Sphingosinicella sp. BN140058]|nr:L-fucose:H+ symporter permease [Sphingosinicella sp. BN140058]